MRRLTIALTLVIAIPSVALAADPGGTFTDDDGNTFEGWIEAVAAEEITKGCNPPFNDRYCPSLTVDRGAMAAFIKRALNLPNTAQDYFDDDNNSIFENDINSLAEAGITKGCNPPANNLFCPTERVTREVMAAFLKRALNLPASQQDFFTDDNNSIFENDINAIAEAGITLGCNPPANNLYCPKDYVKRDTMAAFLGRGLGLTAMTPDPRPPLEWDLVVGGLTSPIQALVPPGEDRILIAQQTGEIRIFENGSLQNDLFLDVPVITGGERGLLSIAIHPDYPADRRLFVWRSVSGGTQLTEYDIAADLDSASSPRTVLSVTQPASNHNGGFLEFGPDGYLYLGLGDGGSSNDPWGNARNLNTLLGKMIRIDVDGALPYENPPDNPYVGVAGKDEIWASGLRNPWRWTIHDGYMYIGDVGQDAREEINVVELVPDGYDFGWARYEGTRCNPNDPDPSCSTAGLTFPVAEYTHSFGGSVTGGVVYDGDVVKSLSDYYLYADFSSGLIRGFRLLNGNAVESIDLTSELQRSGIVNFSKDSDGEILVVSLFSGAVYRLIGG